MASNILALYKTKYSISHTLSLVNRAFNEKTTSKNPLIYADNVIDDKKEKNAYEMIPNHFNSSPTTEFKWALSSMCNRIQQKFYA